MKRALGLGEVVSESSLLNVLPSLLPPPSLQNQHDQDAFNQKRLIIS